MPKLSKGQAIGRASNKRGQPKSSLSRRPPGPPEEPLGYMLRVMRDPDADDKRRDSMARQALPYRHAKRTGAEHTLKPLVEMNEAELEIVRGNGKDR